MSREPDPKAVAASSESAASENTSESSVLRIKPRKRGWVPLSRALLDDTRLQFDTRAIAAWLIAKPDGWQIRSGALPYLLQQRAGPGERVGRDRVQRMLRELEIAGYITRSRSKKPDGRWIWRIELSDAPAPHASTIAGSAVDGSAVDGRAVAGQGGYLSNTLNYPKLDNKRTTTTQEPKPTERPVTAPAMAVDYPAVLQGRYLTSARKLMAGCPPGHQQAILEEIGAMHSRGCVRSPLGLLRSLIEKAKRGEFLANHSLSVDLRSNERRYSRDALRSKDARKVSEIARETIADLRKEIKSEGS